MAWELEDGEDRDEEMSRRAVSVEKGDRSGAE